MNDFNHFFNFNSVAIYNESGHLVKELNNLSGSEYNFNTEGIEAGIYFYKILFESATATGKFIKK